ncbi:hypothetical protein TRFO_11541 [Tritrichomonas foetus]|uniref:Myb-like DNA-binding domain containing protein n=1 Tax=Tritrichomonas foetus TaxID=1144522 RepID=A0A1J4J8N1_9EUKA|nr:hypothetical protein TRFO_11541 [Tritrichomonas foetus]|eukprot:OHS93757.1 hypothetical protein TRFO_11541 [Tritrichomonas foetus]
MNTMNSQLDALLESLNLSFIRNAQSPPNQELSSRKNEIDISCHNQDSSVEKKNQFVAYEKAENCLSRPKNVLSMQTRSQHNQNLHTNQKVKIKKKTSNQCIRKKQRYRFSCEEDSLLLTLVDSYEGESQENNENTSLKLEQSFPIDKRNNYEKSSRIDWNQIASHINGRTARQCRERYRNYLYPNLNNSPWSKEEDNLLEEKFVEIGPRWSSIARFFINRSEVNVKNRHYLLSSYKNKDSSDQNRKINNELSKTEYNCHFPNSTSTFHEQTKIENIDTQNKSSSKQSDHLKHDEGNKDNLQILDLDFEPFFFTQEQQDMIFDSQNEYGTIF